MEDLVSQLVNELTDPEYQSRKHYSRSTYKDGCEGPLCRKSERDRMRRKRNKINPDRKPRPKPAELIAEDAFLDKVIEALGLRNEEQAPALAS